MQYAPITALLVEAVKEQQKLIDELRAEIETLKIDNMEIKAEVQEIKELIGVSAKNN